MTNSTGMGFGLWETASMINENKGLMIIHSGNHQLICSSKKQVTRAPYWQGTFTFMKLNTDIPVSYDRIFDSKGEKDMYNELKEELIGDIEDLW